MGWLADYNKVKNSPAVINEDELIRRGVTIPLGASPNFPGAVIPNGPNDQRGGGLSVLRNIIQIVGDELATIIGDEGGIRLPNFTTTERDALTAPVNGETIVNTTTNQIETYNSTLAAWVPVALMNPNGVSLATSNTTIANDLAAGATALFGPFNVVSSFFVAQTLRVNVSDTASVSTFDIALYASETQRDTANGGGTLFDAVNRDGGGLVYLGTGIDAASAGPASFFADALGRFYSNETPTPSLYGAVRNNDGANAADFALAMEQYPLIGSKAL